MRGILSIGCVFGLTAALLASNATPTLDVLSMSDAELFAHLRAGEVVQLAKAYASPETVLKMRSIPGSIGGLMSYELRSEDRLEFGFPLLAERCVRSKEATPEEIEVLLRLAEKRTPVLEHPIVHSLRQRIPFQEAPVVRRAIDEEKWEFLQRLRVFVFVSQKDVEWVFREIGVKEALRLSETLTNKARFYVAPGEGHSSYIWQFVTTQPDAFVRLVKAAVEDQEVLELVRAHFPDGLDQDDALHVWEPLLVSHPDVFVEAVRLGLLRVEPNFLEALAKQGKDDFAVKILKASPSTQTTQTTVFSVLSMSDAELFAHLRAGEVVQLAEAYASPETVLKMRKSSNVGDWISFELDPEDRLRFGFPLLAKRCVRSEEATPEDMEILINLAEKRTPVLERSIVNSLRQKIPFQEAPVAVRAITEEKWEIVSGLTQHFVAFSKADIERIFREDGPEIGFRLAKALDGEQLFIDFFTSDAERFRSLIEAAKRDREIVDAIRWRYRLTRGIRGVREVQGRGLEEWQIRDLWGALLASHPETFGDMARLNLLDVTPWTLASLATHGDGIAFVKVIEASAPARASVAEEIVENPNSQEAKLFLERVPENLRAEVLTKNEIQKIALSQDAARLETLRQAGWVSETDFKEAEDARYEAWVKQRFTNYYDASAWFEPYGQAATDLLQVREEWPERVADFSARRMEAGLAWLRKQGPHTYANIAWELQRNAIAIAEAKCAVMPQETPCPAGVLALLILKAPDSTFIPVLMERCADLEGTDPITPLIAAVGVGRPDLIKTLLAHGANPWHKVKAGAFLPLNGILGAGCPGIDTGEQLIGHALGAKLSGVEIFDDETMETYLREGGWRMFASAASAGVATAVVQRGPTAVEQAACVKKPGLIKAFLENGVTFDRDATINTPLAYACAMGNADAIQELLKAGCKANCFVSFGNDCAGAAVTYAVLTLEDEALVRKLVEAGAGVSDEAVEYARIKGWDALGDWLEAKVDPHYYSDYGIVAKAMREEIARGDDDVLRLLRYLRVTEADLEAEAE